MRLCRSGWARLYRWQAGTMARAHLRQLDQAALGDVGLSRQQADREAGKTVWHR
ncbi:MAG: DUF1127 domain-containing protein [Rhodospirillales bacterium]|nr:DUF1127 domain-containing protein [Rhodospirillales bacterium]